MHWNRVLEERRRQLPSSLGSRCVDYKVWKKLTKSAAAFDDFMVAELHAACKRVDHVFRRAFLDIHGDAWTASRCVAWIACCSPESDACTVGDLLTFAQINGTTLYKICKRIDKRGGKDKDSGARSWLCRARTRNKFEFLGGAKLTVLKMTAGPTSPIECPICFNEVKQVIVSHCGHYMCLECVLSLCKIRKQCTGYLPNVLSMQQECSVCPMCRAKNPFENAMVVPHTNSKFVRSNGVIH